MAEAISDQVGSKLLFENDQVRVWDLTLAPGESTGMHRHENDYLYVVSGGGTLQGVSSDGTWPTAMFNGAMSTARTFTQPSMRATNHGETLLLNSKSDYLPITKKPDGKNHRASFVSIYQLIPVRPNPNQASWAHL